MEHIKDILPPQKNSKVNSTSPCTEPEYKCPVCKDTGTGYPVAGGKTDYSQLVPCKCQEKTLTKARRDRMFKYCYLPVDTEGWTLDKFDAYNADLKAALVAAREVANPDGSIKWLTLMGKTEVGKSHLAVGICREWLKNDMPARYVGVPTMLDELRATFELKSEMNLTMKLLFYQTVPLLVLDDLGVEKLTEWGFEKLYTIINSRLENGLPLVVTTNLPVTEIPGDKEHRIGSRLLRHREGKVMVLDAKEYSVYKGRR